MSTSAIDRFLKQYRLVDSGPARFLSRPSQELMALSRRLRQMPLRLHLVRLDAQRRQDLQMPLPPHLHQIALALAGLLRRRPELGRRLGLSPQLVEAVLQRHVDLGKLIQLAEGLQRTAATGTLLLGAALHEVNQGLLEAAERLSQDESLDPARRAYLQANMGAVLRLRARQEANRLRRAGRQAARRARAEAELGRARAETEALRAIEELKDK
ncbi:MAG: hypothetical protein RMK29_19475 [Myxococcales bacterium]|nr:hypothetical protein [Myxococcota bacterium]MDW8283888.1 hypothetical protein [Myxococcales bacterium]